MMTLRMVVFERLCCQAGKSLTSATATGVVANEFAAGIAVRPRVWYYKHEK